VKQMMVFETKDLSSKRQCWETNCDNQRAHGNRCGSKICQLWQEQQKKLKQRQYFHMQFCKVAGSVELLGHRKCCTIQEVVGKAKGVRPLHDGSMTNGMNTVLLSFDGCMNDRFTIHKSMGSIDIQAMEFLLFCQLMDMSVKNCMRRVPPEGGRGSQ